MSSGKWRSSCFGLNVFNIIWAHGPMAETRVGIDWIGTCTIVLWTLRPLYPFVFFYDGLHPVGVFPLHRMLIIFAIIRVDHNTVMLHVFCSNNMKLGSWSMHIMHQQNACIIWIQYFNFIIFYESLSKQFNSQHSCSLTDLGNGSISWSNQECIVRSG